MIGSTNTRGPRNPSSARRCAGFGLVGAVGLAALIGALVEPWTAWSWPLTSADALAGAEVNAEIRSIGPAGLIVARQGTRHISVISPPLRLRPGTSPCFRAVVRQMSDGDPGAGPVAAPSDVCTVRLLWQESPGAAYRFVEQRTPILQESGFSPAEEPAEPRTGGAVQFQLPIPPERIHRIGIQLADAAGPIRISRFELPRLSWTQRLTAAWNDLSTAEPIGNHSVNFLRGPRVLGWSINGIAICLGLVAFGAMGLRDAIRRRPWAWARAGAALLIAWGVVDLWATWNLAQQLHVDLRRFAGADDVQSRRLAHGDAIADTADAMLAAAAAGSTYVVLSDDPFAPAHRIDYLLAPRYQRVDDPAVADYVAVIARSGARFDARRQSLLVDALALPADLVWRESDHVMLLKSRRAP